MTIHDQNNTISSRVDDAVFARRKYCQDYYSYHVVMPKVVSSDDAFYETFIKVAYEPVTRKSVQGIFVFDGT